jgi:uncharacterized oxidoreductase
MPSVAPDALHRFAVALFVAAGATPEDAEAVAAHLVDANRCGHDSHGVVRAPGYLRAIAEGRTIPGAELRLERDDGATATLDGGWNFGQLVAARAMELACERARARGVAVVIAYRSAHGGRLGAYVEQAAAAGLIGVVMANNHGASARVAPFGGATARLATDPMAFGLPTDDPAAPVVLDIATSVVAEGKVRVARNAGREVPDGWLLDSAGQPSNDPAALYSDPPGALLPLGGEAGHKGFGLALVVEALAGALSPAGATRPTDGRPDAQRGGNALFVMAIDPERFAGRQAFEASLGGLTREVRQPPFAGGVSEVLLPGEPERRARRERAAAIPLDDGTWAQLGEAAAALGVAPPEPAE